MRRTRPSVVSGKGVSHAWAKAFLEMVNAPHEVSPLFLRIELGDGIELESRALRLALDEFYESKAGWKSVQTVSATIFPDVLWNLSGGDRHELFRLYMREYNRIKGLDRQNSRGTYFGRMVEGCERAPNGQLEYVINTQRANPSAARIRLQISIFDPDRDHGVGALPGFPCMQQLSLARHGNEVEVNAFYASQLLLQKGYGNYLGLTKLGKFIAGEMGLTLRAVNVFAGIAKVDTRGRSTEYLQVVEVARGLCDRMEPGV